MRKSMVLGTLGILLVPLSLAGIYYFPGLGGLGFIGGMAAGLLLRESRARYEKGD